MHITLGFCEPTRKKYEPIPIEEQVELLSLVGNIVRDDQQDAFVPRRTSHAPRPANRTTFRGSPSRADDW